MRKTACNNANVDKSFLLVLLYSSIVLALYNSGSLVNGGNWARKMHMIASKKAANMDWRFDNSCLSKDGGFDSASRVG